MAKYRKRPVIVEAEVYKPGMEDGSYCEPGVCIYDVEDDSYCQCGVCDKFVPYIETLEGNHIISKGDYIITGVKKERYPCKPDIFELTYEPADAIWKKGK